MSKALIIVDLQNDFAEGGSLACAGGMELGRKVSEEIDRDQYRNIVATADWHIAPGDHWSDTPDFKNSWPVHCRADSPGAEFVWTLDRSMFSDVFDKGMHDAAYSGFEGVRFSGNLDSYLKDRGITEVDIVGIALDYCVKATALDAVRLGYKTNVLLDYTVSVDRHTAHAAMKEMHDAGVDLSATVGGVLPL